MMTRKMRKTMTNNVTPKQIKQYKKDLQRYNASRQAFLWSAIGCFIGGTLIIIALISGVVLSYQIFQFLLFMVYLSFIAGILLFILRSALYNKRIANRKRIIAEYNRSRKQQQ